VVRVEPYNDNPNATRWYRLALGAPTEAPRQTE